MIKIAIAHYQFETIHPFLDGNGRVGRLLITLYLVASGILEKPLLYISAFFEKNRSLYYEKLTITRDKNDLKQWIKYFLIGIMETAEEGTDTLQRIMQLKSKSEAQIMAMGKRSSIAHKLLLGLFKNPVASVKEIQAITGLSAKAAGDLTALFVEHGILTEITKQQRNRVFSFKDYLDLFSDKK